MTTTIYHGSKGPVEIATMNGKHAATAAAKLRREAPDRIAEIEALEIHAASCAIITEGEAEPAAAAAAPIPSIGDNGGPPLLTAWEAIKTNLDDLLTEAANWADGVEITTQEQADEVGRLRGMLQQAIGAADDARVAEKKPLDEAIAEIQDRYNAYIAPLKNKAPGKASKAVAALGNVLTAWLTKLDNEKRAREAAAAAEARKAAAAALAAREEAKAATDLQVMDKADELLANAEDMLRQAKGVAREKVQAGGGDGLRVQSLRTTWRAEITDRTEALKAFIKRNPEEFLALIQHLADAEARGARTPIAGITYHEERKVA